MARKLPGLRRELDARALFSVAYGEIASSIYFALGIVAAHALGFTPLVLLGVGLLFLIVSLSYAEGTAALPETGGAATFVRRASNDLAGFLTGWALFLDYLIVIALSALFLPHYLSGALGVSALDRNPWDVVVAVAVIAAVALLRLVRRPSLYGVGIVVPALDLLTQLLLVVLGFALVFSPHALMHGTSLGTHPTWHSLAFALPLAMLAFTGLETVANLAAEARRPGVDLPRSVFGGIATVVTMYVAIAVVALSAFPGPQTELGGRWIRAPLLGVAHSIGDQLPHGLGGVLEFYVGITGALILLVAVTTSISGSARLAYSLGEHGQLPRSFGRLSRRAHVSPQAIIAAAIISSGIVIATSFLHHDVAYLASLFSFGVLIAFTAAQLAVIKLRISEPDLVRPYRVPLNVRIRGSAIPVPSIVGAIGTGTIFVIALATHPAARYAGPVWLAIGLVVFVAVRHAHGEGPDGEGDRARRAAAGRDAPVQVDPRADEARHHRGGDAGDGDQAGQRSGRAGARAARDPRAAGAAPRRTARRRGRAGRGVARGGEAPRVGALGGGRRDDGSGTGDRRCDRGAARTSSTPT